MIKIRVSKDELRKINKRARVILEKGVSEYLRELAMNDIKQNSPDL